MPNCLFNIAASDNASGPICDAAAPTASEVCFGSRPCTRLPHLWAVTDMNPEARHMGLAHNLGLILVLDMYIIDGAVAAGTRGRPWNLDFFIHRLLRNRPVRLLSVRLSLFPSCPFRIGFGLAFGKRSRLPLRCSPRQIQFLLQSVSLLTKPILF